MEPARCPSCHAVVASGADWCSLCYADLRPAGERQDAEQRLDADERSGAEMPGEAQDGSALDMVPWAVELPVPEALSVGAGAAVAAPPLSPHPIAPSPIVSGDDASTDSEAAAGWPCLSCGARAALELDSCPECGKPFLAGGDPPVSLHIPIVGDLAQVNPGTRFIVGLGAAAVLCAVFIVLLLVLGKLI